MDRWGTITPVSELVSFLSFCFASLSSKDQTIQIHGLNLRFNIVSILENCTQILSALLQKLIWTIVLCNSKSALKLMGCRLLKGYLDLAILNQLFLL